MRRITATDTEVVNDTRSLDNATGDDIEASYVLNKNTKKFHVPTCSSVSQMKEKNKIFFEGSRQDVIDQGYVPCKNCNP